ncbi:MAG TPA: tRNA preQ1(34) S-adenosylmethionine ribosyltransferase-isomerase QueA [Longimicrobiales bacterium]|nr:tRNA preQ1(34) S-adenosylmethionine ribosyltransferase-isomerase QueA [Longimicrobiales bacterium]
MPEREPLTTSSFDYDLPPDLIASHPAAERDASRLLVVRRDRDSFEHRAFRDIVELIAPGDILVLNETRVFPARLLGTRAGGGAAEVVLLHPITDSAPIARHAASKPAPAPDLHGDWPMEWTALVRPGAKMRKGRTLRIADDLEVGILDVLEDGTRRVRLNTRLAARTAIERYGRMPLPPYIERAAEPEDVERYQTVYARTEGSVAAPTAGLHFTPALLAALRERGVDIAAVVLHVGVGTFRPVEAEDPAEHPMHEEWYEVTEAEAERMNRVRADGGRVWAVGTTVARTLESVTDDTGAIHAGSGWTRLFIRPGYRFRAVDALITNFHLPRSTLLMLVSAFAGYDRTRAAYDEAIRERYRFYSYGDAMAIL